MGTEGRRPARDVRTRRDAAHREKLRGGTPPPKAERKFRLSHAASLMLDVYALGSGRNPSAIVEALILTHCDGYELHAKRGGGGGEGQGGG